SQTFQAVEDLVQAMSGNIWVESEIGKGSRFHFTAAFGVPAEDEKRSLPNDVSLADARVLVVDDNVTNRRILTDLLWGWRMKPTPAASAQEALSLLRNASECGSPFDLVISDVHMPGMDGFDLAKCVKDLAKSVIMLLTSGEQLGDAARCRELGISTCLVK